MRPLYIFWGKVRSGKKRGKSLGFPTANIALHKKIEEGIYISVVVVAAKAGIQSLRHSELDSESSFPSLAFIGSAKTYNEKDYKAEVHLLNIDMNLYDKWLTVRLLKKIRDNKKFYSEKELIESMEKDKKKAKEFFNNQH